MNPLYLGNQVQTYHFTVVGLENAVKVTKLTSFVHSPTDDLLVRLESSTCLGERVKTK